MYARLILKTGCTLQQLRDDLVNLLTGVTTSPLDLASADKDTSEIVTVLAPEWTFVQHLADTATRCHFVLSGVDNGGLPKTLGVIMTDTSGTLGMVTWVCGAWDSVNKRPAAIDVTGWPLSTQTSAADFEAGAARNGLIIQGSANSVHTIGIYNTGAMQLQVASEQGVTGIYTHYSTTHHVLVEVVDVDRSVWSEWEVSKWPFTLINTYSTLGISANSGSCVGVGGSVAGAVSIGLMLGPSSSNWDTLNPPLSGEVAVTLKCWPSHRTPFVSNSTVDFSQQGSNAPITGWYPTKAGVNTYAPKQNALIPRTAAAPLPVLQIPIPHRVSGRIYAAGTGTLQTINYPEELAANGDIYVGTGTPNCCVYKG